MFSCALTLSRKFVAFVRFVGAIDGKVRFVQAHAKAFDDTETRYRVSPSLRSTHNQDGAIVLDVQNGQIFRLNYVGSEILQLLKSKSDVCYSEITDRISQEFRISRETACADVGEFLRQLAARHLIEETSPESVA